MPCLEIYDSTENRIAGVSHLIKVGVAARISGGCEDPAWTAGKQRSSSATQDTSISELLKLGRRHFFTRVYLENGSEETKETEYEIH